MLLYSYSFSVYYTIYRDVQVVGNHFTDRKMAEYKSEIRYIFAYFINRCPYICKFVMFIPTVAQQLDTEGYFVSFSWQPLNNS